MSNVIGLVRNDGTIGVTTSSIYSEKKYGICNKVGDLANHVEEIIENCWEDDGEFDLTNEHKNLQFAHDVMESTTSALDIDYSKAGNKERLANLDALISDLTKLRKRYG